MAGSKYGFVINITKCSHPTKPSGIKSFPAHYTVEDIFNEVHTNPHKSADLKNPSNCLVTCSKGEIENDTTVQQLKDLRVDTLHFHCKIQDTDPKRAMVENIVKTAEKDACSIWKTMMGGGPAKLPEKKKARYARVIFSMKL